MLCLDIIPNSEHTAGLMVVGCKDHNVTICTLEGATVGILGV